MEEEKVNIEEISINLGYVKKELEDEKPEFQENQYEIVSNFENISRESSNQRNNGDRLIDFVDVGAIVKAESVKEENKDLVQDQLEIIQCHCCKVWFEKWEHLENHMLHCLKKSNRLNDKKLDIQQKPAEEIEKTQGNSEISTVIDDNRSRLHPTYADGISKVSEAENFSEKKHKCSECSYQTNYKHNLKAHLNIHNNIKPFECDICKIKFTQKNNLNAHIMNIHSNSFEKRYKCCECSYQTNRKSNLKIHLIVHNKITAFECDICKTRFTQKSSLRTHIRHQHSNINENIYKCTETLGNGEISTEIDDKRSCLTLTEAIESKYADEMNKSCKQRSFGEKKHKCTECSFQSNYKSNLNKHLNVHNNINPFECDICKRRFNQKGNLKKHIMNIHFNINEKKYKCTECSYRTTVKGNLKIHRNRH